MPFPAMNPAFERALVARAYAEPTPVQLAVLETGAVDRDMLVSAQTGSGKTVAFGLALAHRLLGDAERFEAAAEPLALIIAPTRELAVQVQRELSWLYAETGASIASCVGGMDPRAERQALGEGAHIVVGTPGRLRDHLERGRLVMSQLRAVVLDEADEMLDLGFRDDLQFILDATPAERQTLMFSATVPREIESLARSYQRDAVRISTTVRNQQHDDIEYRAVRTVPYAIEPTIVNLLRYYDMRSTLVFCATREGVRRLHAGLVGRGFSAVALSGELSQAERTEALQAVRDGRARVLVATDVAARGLDLADLALVIHSDLPNDHETLLHRSGRTGRAGRKGISVLVVPPNKRRRAEELLGRGRIDAAWSNVPTARDIAAKDQERLLALPILDELATAEDLALGRELLDGRTPEQVAAALVRMYRAGLPTPESLKDIGRTADQDRKPGAGDRARDDRPRRERPERPVRPVRHERPERAAEERPHAGRGSYGPRVPREERIAMHSDRQVADQVAGEESLEQPISGLAPFVETARPTESEVTSISVSQVVRPASGVPADVCTATGEAVVADRASPAVRPPHADRDDARPEREFRPREDRVAHRPASAEHRTSARTYADQGGMVWFGLNIGREKNADPRWLLPLICRVGEVTKSEIGSIKIAETESTFQIRAEHADQFAAAVKSSKHKEGRIWRLDEAAASSAAAAPREKFTPHAASDRAPDPARKARPSADADSNSARTDRRPYQAQAKPRQIDERAEHKPSEHKSGYAKKPWTGERKSTSESRGPREDARPSKSYERPDRKFAGAKKPWTGERKSSESRGPRDEARPSKSYERPDRKFDAAKKPWTGERKSTSEGRDAREDARPSKSHERPDRKFAGPMKPWEGDRKPPSEARGSRDAARPDKKYERPDNRSSEHKSGYTKKPWDAARKFPSEGRSSREGSKPAGGRPQAHRGFKPGYKSKHQP